MDLTPAKINEFFQLLDFSFQGYLKQVPTFWNQIATEVPSGSEQNVYPFLSALPQFRVWAGPRVINNVAARAFTVPNIPWELTLAFDMFKLRDDTYGVYNQLMPMAALNAAEWRDRELARVVEAGTTALGWDGQFFFDVDHPVDPDNAATGIQSNKLVGAGFDIAVADPLVPFQAARAAMALWKRENGQQIGTIGNLIMCHPNEEKYALQIANAMMTAQAVAAGASAAGVSNVFYGKVEVLVNPFLTVTTGRPWYLLCTNRGLKPFIWQQRDALQTQLLTAMNDQNVFQLHQLMWGWWQRGAASYTFPFLAFRMSAS